MKKLNTITDVFAGKKTIPGGLFPELSAADLHFFLPYLFNVTPELAHAGASFINAVSKVVNPFISNSSKFKSVLYIPCNSANFCLYYTLKQS